MDWLNYIGKVELIKNTKDWQRKKHDHGMAHNEWMREHGRNRASEI